MQHRKSSTKILRALCAKVDPDDGIDPRERARGSPGPRRGPDRKPRQLCSQVAERLGEVLAGQNGDDVLRNLYVVAVVPGPDVRRLLVTVAALPGAGDDIDPGRAIERLQHASARLRCAVAAAITRRRAPVLDYRFALPAGSARERGG
jgi:ribosome-binding factor A